MLALFGCNIVQGGARLLGIGFIGFYCGDIALKLFNRLDLLGRDIAQIPQLACDSVRIVAG
ncbi:MAG: hypothetical protein EBV69_11110 [Oxalobacteraceae bacterium]|nr:hypothetical protein [Oxalobacteraceae bacterium]